MWVTLPTNCWPLSPQWVHSLYICHIIVSLSQGQVAFICQAADSILPFWNCLVQDNTGTTATAISNRSICASGLSLSKEHHNNLEQIFAQFWWKIDDSWKCSDRWEISSSNVLLLYYSRPRPRGSNVQPLGTRTFFSFDASIRSSWFRT